MIKKIKYALFSVILILFLASRLFFFKDSFIERIASYITYPVIQISSAISKPIRRYFKHRRSYQNLLKYCEKLKKEQSQLLEKNIKLEAMLHYDQKSKHLLEFEKRYELENAILARILVKTITNDEHSFIVNRGSRDGIEKNMVAIYKLQLLGRVSKVFPWYSKITLITDSYSKIAAYTNTSNVTGVVEGKNNIDTCNLSYISHLKPVHNNDLVFSSGKGLIFPEGFCLGKIINIKTKHICHHVEVEPLIDLQEVEMCHLTNQSKMNLF